MDNTVTVSLAGKWSWGRIFLIPAMVGWGGGRSRVWIQRPQIQGRGFRGNWTNCIWSKKRCKSTMDTFHFILIPRNSGNFSWDVNGTHILWAFHWKIPGNKWTFEKVVPFSCWNFRVQMHVPFASFLACNLLFRVIHSDNCATILNLVTRA